ncbi:MAG: hypothetical protein ACEY3L_00140 [Wolbachia sp.]
MTVCYVLAAKRYRGGMTITSSFRYLLAAEIPRMNRGMTVNYSATR